MSFIHGFSSLRIIEDYIRSYDDGSLVPILMKDSSTLNVYSKHIDPFLLHFGALCLVITAHESKGHNGAFLSARLVTRFLSQHGDPVILNSNEPFSHSSDFNSLLDLLSSQKAISSCEGLPEKYGHKNLLVERFGEEKKFIYRSPNCSFVVEGRDAICSQCAKLRPPDKKEDSSEDMDMDLFNNLEERDQTSSKFSTLSPKRTIRKRSGVVKTSSKNSLGINCPSCDKTFAIPKEYKLHCKEQHPEINICQEVEDCLKKFKDKIGLEAHVRRHRGFKKPFPCSLCDKTFLSNGDLKTHSLSHTGEKHFECEVCSKKFARKCQIRIHMAVHTGEKPYLCTECGSSFGSMSTLIDHRKRLHQALRPYKCQICFKCFYTRQDLNAHARIHTGERPYTCTICDKSFTRSHHLKRHSATVHRHKASLSAASLSATLQGEEEEVDDVMVIVGEEKERETEEIVLRNSNFEGGSILVTKGDIDGSQILEDNATSSLLELSQIVTENDVQIGDNQFEETKYVIIERDDGSAKLIQCSPLER